MIAETGSVEAGGNTAAWLTGAAAWMKTHQGISAFVYVDPNHAGIGAPDHESQPRQRGLSFESCNCSPNLVEGSRSHQSAILQVKDQA